MGRRFVAIGRDNDSTRDERRQRVHWFEVPHVVGVFIVAFLLDAGEKVFHGADTLFADAFAVA